MDGLVIAAHPYLPQYGYKALSAVLLTARSASRYRESFLIGTTLLAGACRGVGGWRAGWWQPRWLIHHNR